MPYPSIAIVDYESVTAAGVGLAAQRQALRESRSGLSKNDFPHSHLDTWIGRVAAADDFHWAAPWESWRSRNNALAAIGLQQGSLRASIEHAKSTLGTHRVGVVIGSSTSNIEQTEQAYHHLSANGMLTDPYRVAEVFNPHGPGMFVAQLCGLSGPALTLNTACSSSAKVFATAARWLSVGFVDAVLVGGIDSLALSVLHGFHSLQLVSTDYCRPFDQKRDGINLGEAAGYALLTRAQQQLEHTDIILSGYGESSDAHHMSHPHPEGLGARVAVEDALKRARLVPADIDYINLHGTATRANDHAEGNVIAQIFGPAVPASSTKGWTGHTLGAAGIVEAIFSIETLRSGLIPGTLHLQTVDRDIALAVNKSNLSSESPLHHVMSNSFGFGGNNCSLIFSRMHA